MTKAVTGTASLALVVAFVCVGTAASDRALTNADIVRLTKAGAGEAAIVAMIETSAADFDTGVDEIVQLGEAGVGETVIAAMVKAAAMPPATPSRNMRDVGPAREPRAPGSVFRDRLEGGGEGPAMVVVPAGHFRMGCLSNDDDCYDDEKPVREVAIPAPFALSVHEVTFADYDRFTYPNKVEDEGWGRDRRPVVYVRWNHAREYVEWLSARTGAEYRLPSEAEWEYAARAGTATKYHWGNELGVNRANCDVCGSEWDNRQTAPVGSFAPNAFGLHDMHGNVWEWVEDCWNDTYADAPTDGSAWVAGDCIDRVLRGGSWGNSPRNLRAAIRAGVPSGSRFPIAGFRVARTLTR